MMGGLGIGCPVQQCSPEAGAGPARVTETAPLAAPSLEILERAADPAPPRLPRAAVCPA